MDDKISLHEGTVIMPQILRKILQMWRIMAISVLFWISEWMQVTLLGQHLTAAARNATYTSSVIQNQVIDVLADQVSRRSFRKFTEQSGLVS